jgi:voltage-gated potassium channel
MGASRNYVTAPMARWRAATDVPLLVLAIGSLPMLLLELIREDLTHSDRIALDIVNITVLVAFAIDYIVEIIVASNRPSYVRHEWPSLLIVVAQGLAIIPALAAFGVLRLLRAGRAWRAIATVVRAFAAGSVMAREGRSALRRHAASLALGVAGLTWISSAVAFTLAEDVGDGHRIDSFFDALWWSSATITTVGYGDVYPITTAGRLVGVVTMVVGISTFAVVTAKVAQFLVLDDRRSSEAGESVG